ncbi:GNAT family N-acetyltransferase [Longimicrobium terrae]|uniref:GNAT superfamily N-acetyltransferase n=1 Tax=Longimicrobium terrae TaxID=1639882 RepID=A0A841H2D6_9BACT|nr:GNAT family N-acetyltransferase [Longimicrobium terrae]MBB4637731.1 GNAT superfamily N-acetyltransferase [Longimicrobium terrae]MBB6072128.1 GNAT superfamily N-acetyltransferase [Longimicrobium terrae]NNC29790.1 GNAT family N-acetyltransferase [Longimicrobium terrae]
MTPADNAIRLRPATPEDADAVAALLGELGYPTTPEQARVRMARIRDDADYHTVLAESDGEVLGLIGLQRGWGYEHDRPFVRVLALVVAGRARRRGVGACLIAAADDFARLHDAHDMHLTTALHREEAHRFYEGLGFNRSGWRYTRPVG